MASNPTESLKGDTVKMKLLGNPNDCWQIATGVKGSWSIISGVFRFKYFCNLKSFKRSFERKSTKRLFFLGMGLSSHVCTSLFNRQPCVRISAKCRKTKTTEPIEAKFGALIAAPRSHITPHSIQIAPGVASHRVGETARSQLWMHPRWLRVLLCTQTLVHAG